MVNDTPSVPTNITGEQLNQVLYHCIDILGNITANAYCFAGCDAKSGDRNDQCIQ